MSYPEGLEKGLLTDSQREFMLALQDSVNNNGGPVTVKQIVVFAEKSDSRVRAHIKKLIASGFVCCVGKAKRRGYVPAMKWLQEPNVNEDDCICIGGFCQTRGCDALSVACWKTVYLCRQCLMGAMDKKDPLGREAYYRRMGPQSPAGWES